MYGIPVRFHKGDKRSYKLTEEDVVFLASHTNYTKEEKKTRHGRKSRILGGGDPGDGRRSTTPDIPLDV